MPAPRACNRPVAPPAPAAVLAAVVGPLAEMCARSSEALNPSAASRWVGGPRPCALLLLAA